MTETLQDIERQIQELQKKKEQLQSEHHETLVRVLKRYGVTTFDKTTLAGLLIEACNMLKDHPDKANEWNKLGKKFLEEKDNPLSEKPYYPSVDV